MTTEREKIIALARDFGLDTEYLENDFIAFYKAAQAEAMDEGFNMGSDYFSNQIKTLTEENARLRAALETVKLHSVSLADAQVTALKALKGQP